MTIGLFLERRSALRYNFRLPVIFHWNDGAEHRATGFTSELSPDGALILGSKCPPLGSKVWIEILLPSADTSGRGLRMKCVGRVTRVVVRPGNNTFGVQGLNEDDYLKRKFLI